MTLLNAVESLALVERTAVSCIHVVPFRKRHVAFFTIAFLLPFLGTELSDEFKTGQPRFWTDQARFLESETAIEDQILELHQTRALGNLSQIHLKPTGSEVRELWIVETHCGNEVERLTWMEAVIAFEGRSPWREVLR